MSFNVEKAEEFVRNWDQQSARLTEASKRLKDSYNYESIRRSLENLCRASFGPVAVHFFGSRIIGLATETSDLDIFIDIGEKFYSSFKPATRRMSSNPEHDRNYHRLVSAVKNNIDWVVEEEVLKTAVPIIISIFKPLKMNCKFLEI